MVAIWFKFRDELFLPYLHGSDPIYNIPFSFGELAVGVVVGGLGYPFFSWVRLRLDGLSISFADYLSSAIIGSGHAADRDS